MTYKHTYINIASHTRSQWSNTEKKKKKYFKSWNMTNHFKTILISFAIVWIRLYCVNDILLLLTIIIIKLLPKWIILTATVTATKHKKIDSNIKKKYIYKLLFLLFCCIHIIYSLYSTLSCCIYFRTF